MTEIRVNGSGSGPFVVEIDDGGRTTRHEVQVPERLANELALSEADHERLVRESFAFLLEREPATSILSRFSLDQISDYFPEYETDIRRRFAG
ncbi:MAG TPA: hypothetical protein VE976_08040 [Actinomycetota bacterium]|nr:hypothetical protein [Actinomycetota bacterium]